MPTETFYNLKTEKKERVIQAIIKELSSHTYEHINLSNIVRDSGIARGSFYQYFKDKDDLFIYFFQYIGEKKAIMYQDLFDPKNDLTFLERFKMMYLRGFKFAQTYPELVGAGYNMMQSKAFMDSEMLKVSMEQGILYFENLIKIDQEKGIIRPSIDARLLASMILDYMNKMTFESYIHPSMTMDSIEHYVNLIADILQKGIETDV